MPLEFNIIIFLENIEPPFKFIFSLFLAFFQNCLWYQCTETTSCCNQPLMIFVNKFFINSWVFAIHAFNKTERRQLHKISVTLFIFCQQNLVMPRILFVF